jgi:hypothetical protein
MAKLLIALLFLSTNVTRAISQSSPHQHDHGSSRSCDLCHPGHIQLISTPGVGSVAPSGTSEWRQSPSVSERILTGSISRASSRAPPQL